MDCVILKFSKAWGKAGVVHWTLDVHLLFRLNLLQKVRGEKWFFKLPRKVICYVWLELG